MLVVVSSLQKSCKLRSQRKPQYSLFNLLLIVQTDAHPIAHFLTRMAGSNGSQEPLEIEVIIRREVSSETITDQEEPMASERCGRRGSRYVHAFTTNLSDANKKGLDSLAYWSIGPRKSKTHLINQALVQYLAQYKESQQAIPTEET